MFHFLFAQTNVRAGEHSSIQEGEVIIHHIAYRILYTSYRRGLGKGRGPGGGLRFYGKRDFGSDVRARSSNIDSVV